MDGTVKEHWKASLGSAIVLALFQSLGWLYLHALSQYLVFGGQTGNGDDFGLGTMFPGWVIAAGWSWLIALRLNQRLTGCRSVAAFILGGIVAAPLSYIVILVINPFDIPHVRNDLAHLLFSIFQCLGLGILPEGRASWAGAHTVSFIIMAALSMLGYVRTFSRAKMMAAAATVVLLLTPRPTSAYDTSAHDVFLTKEAANILNSKTGNRYLELKNRSTDIGGGAIHEDDGANMLRHFYYAPTGRGLPIWDNAAQWLESRDYFNQAVSLYKTNQKTDAFANLGHVLHLATQDMFSPPHVSNDIHLNVGPTWVYFAPNSYEPWVEENHGYVADSAQHMGQTIPEITDSPTYTLTNNAAATYAAILIPGSLSEEPTTPASGPLGTMFPPGYSQAIQLTHECVASDPDTGFCNVEEAIWRIPDNGDCRQFSGAEGNPGARDHWWKAVNLPTQSGTNFYIENPRTAFPKVYKDGSDTNYKSLAELWALSKERLIARSQEASAGLMKQFARLVDRVAPMVELRQNDAQGTVIPPGGAGGQTIFLRIKDPAGNDPGGDADYPTPSGIFQVALKNTDTNNVVEISPAIPADGQNPVERSLSGLAEGPYQLTAYDGMGNEVSIRFFIGSQPAPPTITLSDMYLSLMYETFSGTSPVVPVPSTLFGGNAPSWMTLTVESHVQGPVVTTVLDSAGQVISTTPINTPGMNLCTGDYSLCWILPAVGRYTIRAVDALGGKTLAPFRLVTIAAAPPSLTGAEYDPVTRTFHGTMDLVVDSSLAIDRVDHIDLADNWRLISTDYDERGTYSIELPALSGNDTASVFLIATDMDGNSQFIEVGLAPGAIKIPDDPPGCSLSLPTEWTCKREVLAGVSHAPTASTEFGAGANQSSPLGAGVEIEGLNTNTITSVNVAVGTRKSAPGYRGFVGDSYFVVGVRSNDGLPLSPYTLKFPFDATGLSSAQKDSLDLVRYPLDGSAAERTRVSVGADGKVAIRTAEGGRFSLETPIYASPALVAAGNVSFLSNESGVTVSGVPAQEEGGLRDWFRAEGREVVCGMMKFGPDGQEFSPSGAIKFACQTLAGAHIYQFSASGLMEQLSSLFVGEGYLSAFVPRFHSYFAVMVDTVPAPFVDTTPPWTQAVFVDGPFNWTEEGIHVSSQTRVGLQARDPPSGPYTVSGVATTYFLLDQPFVDMMTTPPQMYDGTPLLLPIGSHLLSYFSADNAGNVETVQVSTIIVDAVWGQADTLPPATTISFQGPQYSVPDVPLIISTHTSISLNASDDASGVAATYLLKDHTLQDCGFGQGLPVVVSTMPQGSCQNPVYSAPFTLAEGTHTLYYLSIDHAGNAEGVHVSSLGVDGTPPSLSFSVLGSSRTDALGRMLLSTGTSLSFLAADPLVLDVSAGVLGLRYRVGEGPEQDVAGSAAQIHFDEGLHVLRVSAYDRVGNEGSFSAPVIVDVSPPAFGELEVAAPGSAFGPALSPVLSSTVDARISVQDLASGLDITGLGASASPPSVLPGKTLGLWHFDEASGNTTSDAGPYGLNASLNPDVERTAGRFGGGIEVHGRTYSDPNEGVTLPPSANTVINNLSQGTVELWAYLKQPGTYPGVGSFVFLVKQTNRQNTEFLFGTNPSGNLSLFWRANNSAVCDSTFQPQLGRWYHLAATWSGSQSSIYVDGVEVQRCGGMALGYNDAPTCFSIAGGCGDANSDGNFIADEVRILNVALSAGEVAQDAGPGLPFSARYSSDGGETFMSVDGSSMSLGGSDGTTSPQSFTVAGLRFQQSLSPGDNGNLVEFDVRDLAGNEGKAQRHVLVNLNPLYAQTLTSPAEGLVLTVSSPTFAWRLDSRVPIEAIERFELQLAGDPSFATPTVLESPTASLEAPVLDDGRYYWRVRAKDNFGTYSPYSSTRSFTIDTAPPVFRLPEAAAAGSEVYASAERPLAALLADVRAEVQDVGSGLSAGGGGANTALLEPIPGTLGLWHFDEPGGTLAEDAGPRGLNGTLNPDVERVAGLMGGGIEVHGRTYSNPAQGVTLGQPAYSIIDNLSYGTVELWAYLKQPGTYPGVGSFVFLVKQSNGQNTEFLFGTNPSGNLSLFWRANNSSTCDSSFQPELGRWYHLAATWSPSQSSIYVNGQEIQRCGGMALGSNPWPTCLSIAGGCGDANSDGNFITDEVRILNIALSSEQIVQDATFGRTTSSVRFSRDGGTTFADLDVSSVTLAAVDGSTSPAKLTARALLLAGKGEGVNVVEMSASDLAGNATSYRFTVVADTMAPAAVTDFAASVVSSTTVTLSWSAPGDDGWEGTIHDAELRLHYSLTPGTEFSTAAAQLVLERTDLVPGTKIVWTPDEIMLGTTYYAAVFTRDSAGNWSQASNTISVRTFTVAASTDGVVEFVSPDPDATVAVVPAQAEPEAYSVAFASQALSPVGDVFYELTAGLVFETPAILSFYFDPLQADPAALAIYTFDGTSWSSSSIVNQQVTLLADGRGLLSGEIYHTSLYASMVADILAPLTAFSVQGNTSMVDGVLHVAPGGRLVLTAQDRTNLGGTASGVVATFYRLDDGPQTAYAGAFEVPAGQHSLAFWSADKAGNTESPQDIAFVMDSGTPPTDVPPVRLQVLGNSRMLHHPWDADGRGGKVYVADTNADRVLVLDAGGAFLAAYGNAHREEPYFEKPKALAADEAGNIFVADTQHHRVVKLSPQGQFLFELGDSRTKKGHKSFHPGSGQAQFRHPSGVALAPDGKIVVSDTGNRRIQVFNADGSFVRAIELPSTSEDFEPDDEDCDRDAPAPFGVDVDAAGNIYVADAKGHRALVFNADGTLRLNVGQKGNASGSFRRPEGIAAAEDGGFFVSDRVLDRIAKFDAQGRLSYVFGKHGEIKDNKPLSQDVVFNKPIGLDFDEQGRLYVADRNNERVQVFGPASMAPVASIPSGGGFRTASAESAEPAAASSRVGADLPAALALLDEQKAKSARSTVEKDKGGKVLRQDKAAVEVPAAALSDDLEITVAAPVEPVERTERRDAREDKKLAAASEPVEYGPEGTTFAVPVTITLPYDKDALLARGMSEDAVKVHYWNPDRKDWEELASTVDKDARTVSAKTMHFSLYQALAPEGQGLRPALTDSEAEFYFRDLYVFPNPARAGAKPTIHFAAGVADSVSVRIYDVSGRLVQEGSIDRPPVVIDDGSGPKYAYEFVWDGHIPSGVYFYAVEAKKSGHGSIKRTGKLAVVR